MSVPDEAFAEVPPHPLPLTRGARDRIAALEHPTQRLNVIARLLAGLAVPRALWKPVPAGGDVPELRLDDSTIVAWRTLERMAAATGRRPRAFLEHVDALLRRDGFFDELSDRGLPGEGEAILAEPPDATEALAAVEPAAVLLTWADDEAQPSLGAALLAFADANGPGRVLVHRVDRVEGAPTLRVLVAWSGGVPVHRDRDRMHRLVARLVRTGAILEPPPPVLHVAAGDLGAAIDDGLQDRVANPPAWRREASDPARVARAFDALGAAMGVLDPRADGENPDEGDGTSPRA